MDLEKLELVHVRCGRWWLDVPILKLKHPERQSKSMAFAGTDTSNSMGTIFNAAHCLSISSMGTAETVVVVMVVLVVVAAVVARNELKYIKLGHPNALNHSQVGPFGAPRAASAGRDGPGGGRRVIAAGQLTSTPARSAQTVTFGPI